MNMQEEDGEESYEGLEDLDDHHQVDADARERERERERERQRERKEGRKQGRKRPTEKREIERNF